VEPKVPALLHQHQQQATGQPVEAPNVGLTSLPLDNNSMLTIVTAVQQFMTEFNDALSEEENVVVR
jgi:hypothetical protein